MQKSGSSFTPHFQPTDLKDFFKRGEKGPGNRIGRNTNRDEPNEGRIFLSLPYQPNKPTKKIEEFKNKRRKKRADGDANEPVSPASLSLRLMNLLPPPASTASHTPMAVTAITSDASARHHRSFIIPPARRPAFPLHRLPVAVERKRGRGSCNQTPRTETAEAPPATTQAGRERPGAGGACAGARGRYVPCRAILSARPASFEPLAPVVPPWCGPAVATTAGELSGVADEVALGRGRSRVSGRAVVDSWAHERFSEFRVGGCSLLLSAHRISFRSAGPES